MRMAALAASSVVNRGELHRVQETSSERSCDRTVGGLSHGEAHDRLPLHR
jgi:hypothetical protein